MRAVQSGIRKIQGMPVDELTTESKNLGAPLELVLEIHKTGKLPVVNFAAGGVATPADAALMMQLGADGVFVGSGIFKSSDPASRAKAVVKATTHYQDPTILAEVSKGLGAAMPGLDIKTIPPEELLATRGW
jgi:pyridoxal 5'-phosphate synthase pdxS subunit